MGIVVEVLGELENFHMSREELEVKNLKLFNPKSYNLPKLTWRLLHCLYDYFLYNSLITEIGGFGVNLSYVCLPLSE